MFGGFCPSYSSLIKVMFAFLMDLLLAFLDVFEWFLFWFLGWCGFFFGDIGCYFFFYFFT